MFLEEAGLSTKQKVEKNSKKNSWPLSELTSFCWVTKLGLFICHQVFTDTRQVFQVLSDRLRYAALTLQPQNIFDLDTMGCWTTTAEITATQQGNNIIGCYRKVQSYIPMKFKDTVRVSAKTLMLSYLLATRSDKPDDPETPVHVGTPLVAPRHRWRDLLRALTALWATRFASHSIKAKSGLLHSTMASCFRALCTPNKGDKRQRVRCLMSDLQISELADSRFYRDSELYKWRFSEVRNSELLARGGGEVWLTQLNLFSERGFWE